MTLKEEIQAKLDILFPNANNEMYIYEYKKYLNDTDYVVIKMYEKVVQGGNIIELLKECKEILSNRAEARRLINELEAKIEQNEENNNTND